MSSRPIIDENLLIELYVDKRMSTTEIAKRFNVAPNTISYKLRKLGIKPRGRRKISLEDEHALVRDYIDGISISKLGFKYSIDKSQAFRILIKHNANIRPRSYINVSKETFYRLYVEEKLPVAVIAQKLECSVPTLVKIRDSYNIPPRRVRGRCPVSED